VFALRRARKAPSAVRGRRLGVDRVVGPALRSAPGVGFPTVRKGWQKRGLVFMTTALILAIVVVLVLAFTAQRLLNNAG
jgi:hypothetical protein